MTKKVPKCIEFHSMLGEALQPGLHDDMKSGFSKLCALGFILSCSGLAQGAASTNSPRLNLERLFDSTEFRSESYGEVTWSKRGAGYFKFEKAQDGDGRDLVRVDPATGRKELIVPT